jgi:hypothetical protein
MSARPHKSPASGSGGDANPPLRPLSRHERHGAQGRPGKSRTGSTPRGIVRRAVLGVVGAALLATASGCSTYSDGSMGNHESMPHTHGPQAGQAHAAGAHMHASSGDGLSATLNDYTLDAVSLADGPRGPHLSFRILGPSGAPQLQFSLDQGKLLHLYVVGADLSTFAHVHPVLDSTGFWQADLPRLRAGVHHVVASVVPITPDSSEQGLLLGTDVLVEGEARRRPLPPEAATASVDGYRVRLSGDLVLAQPTDIKVEITRDGRPADLVPYLDTWVHLSAVNEESLAFVHLHPNAPATSGAPVPDPVSLTTTVPAPGRYRLFVEFATASGLHRVAFTRTAFG